MATKEKSVSKEQPAEYITNAILQDRGIIEKPVEEKVPVEEKKEEPKAEETPKVEDKKEEPKAEEKKEEQKEEPKKEDIKDLQTQLNELADKEENKDKSEDELKEMLLTQLSDNQTKPKKEEPKAEEPGTQDAKFDMEAFIKEKTDGKFENFESVLAKLNETPTELEFASERIKKLNELESKGVDIEQVMRFQSLGLDKIDESTQSGALSLIRLDMKLNDPYLTEKEIDAELRNKYLLNADRDDEDLAESIELAEIRMKRDGRKAKESLAVKQKEVELPSSNNTADPVELAKQREAQENENKQFRSEFNSNVNKNLANYSSENFELDGDSSLEYAVDSDTMKQLQTSMTNTDKFWERYNNEDKTINFDKFRSDMLLLDNKDKIIKAAHNKGIAMGKKSVISLLKNPKQRGSSSSDKATKSMEQQVADNLFSRK
jgi:hypothetical protein